MWPFNRRQNKRHGNENDEIDGLTDLILESVLNKDEDERAEQLVIEFAKVAEIHRELVPDAKFLPASKSSIYSAIDRRIAYYERLCSIQPTCSHWKDRLDKHRVLIYVLADFQEIDTEDLDYVRRANDGELDVLTYGLLFLKYHQRGMKELGRPVDDPMESDGKRLPLTEVVWKWKSEHQDNDELRKTVRELMDGHMREPQFGAKNQ